MKRLFFTAMLIALAAALSGCAVIDYEDVDGAGNPTLTNLTTTATDGSMWTFTSVHFHAVGDPGLCIFGGCADNGTVYIAEEASLGGPITMVSASGAPFSLRGFDGAQLFNDDAAAAAAGDPNATSVVATGTFSGGGTDTQSFALDDVGFKTFTFSWSNLVSVTFSGTIAGGGPGGIALDNIQVSGGAAAEQAPASLGSSVELAPSEAGDPVAAE
jgi:hypothetical protein